MDILLAIVVVLLAWFVLAVLKVSLWTIFIVLAIVALAVWINRHSSRL